MCSLLDDFDLEERERKSADQRFSLLNHNVNKSGPETLNNWIQNKLIKYTDDQAVQGPAHKPYFTITGYADLIELPIKRSFASYATNSRINLSRNAVKTDLVKFISAEATKFSHVAEWGKRESLVDPGFFTSIGLSSTLSDLYRAVMFNMDETDLDGAAKFSQYSQKLAHLHLTTSVFKTSDTESQVASWMRVALDRASVGYYRDDSAWVKIEPKLKKFCTNKTVYLAFDERLTSESVGAMKGFTYMLKHSLATMLNDFEFDGRGRMHITLSNIPSSSTDEFTDDDMDEINSVFKSVYDQMEGHKLMFDWGKGHVLRKFATQADKEAGTKPGDCISPINLTKKDRYDIQI
jgi:hypothetical protein